MTLLTEHTEAGWREVQSGEFGKWVAERLHARPGATSSTIRVEAETSRKLQEAVSLRQSQLAGSEERAKDTISSDGSLVTGEQHEALKTEGLAVAGAEQPVAAEAPPTAPADAARSDEAESQNTQSDEVEATEAAEDAAEELGVDLTKVEGTGQDGRVLKGDVEAAASDDPKE